MKKQAWMKVSNTLMRAWRRGVLKRDNNTCRVCGAQEKLRTHHIQPVRDVINTLLIYDINNGITLCKKCHDKTLNKESNFIEMFAVIIENISSKYLFEHDKTTSDNSFDSVRGRWCIQHPIKSTHRPLTDEEVRLVDERRAHIAQLKKEYEKKMRPVRKKRERALKLCYPYMYPLPNQLDTIPVELDKLQ